jgi:Mn-containing catalase
MPREKLDQDQFKKAIEILSEYYRKKSFDYEALLIKYMKLVMESEGYDFLGRTDSSPPKDFSEEEWKELKTISDKIVRGEDG